MVGENEKKKKRSPKNSTNNNNNAIEPVWNLNKLEQVLYMI